MAETLLIFELCGSRFGLDAARVEGAAQMRAVTRAPFAPALLAGVCELHGGITPVADLAALWGLRHEGEYKCLVLLGRPGERTAILADALTETADPGGALPCPALPGAVGRFIKAALPDGTPILDADRLLDVIFQHAKE